MIRLLAPVWLVLLVPLWLVVRRLPADRPLARGLRAAVFLCILLALARPILRIPAREGVIVAVVDRSASMPDDALRIQQEWLTRLEQAMPARSRLGIIAFAERTAVEQAPQGSGFGGFVSALDGDASNLADALDTAMALIPADAAGRLVVLSDGLYTGRDPIEAALPAMARGIPIDYRFQYRSGAGDVAVAAFDVPSEPRPGERIVLTAWLRAPRPTSVTVRLDRDGRRLAESRRDLAGGLTRLQFVDTVPESGVLHYTLSVPPAPDDPIPENNTARALARVTAERRVLCLTPTPNSGLAALLRRGAVPIAMPAPEMGHLRFEALAGYSAVLIENVPAHHIGRPALNTLVAWVREMGGGLMLTGGRQAYGAGGYFGSPLDPLMPVSMELRQEHRKFSLAVVIVLDRSGSMAMPAGPGRTKMDLANLGCVQVLDLLSEGDALGVLAVDTAVHTIVPLMPVDQARARRGDILGIRSQGGGIFTYTGLRAAAGMLNESTAGARHIILFADAADAEEPGQYRELLERCLAAGITCSVVGLGSPTDVDAEFLRDVAERGGGEIYFTDNADEIPRIFAQDTLAVTRQAFIDEPVGVNITPGWMMLSATPLPAPPAVGGYNLCYLRPGANLAAVTADEDQAPLLAFWQAGAGRVICVTAEADGEFAGDFARWPNAGDFYSTVARWAAGTDDGQGDRVVRHRLSDGLLTVDVHFDAQSADRLTAETPELILLRDRPGAEPERQIHPFQWTAPHQITARVPLHGAETVLAAVRAGDRPPITLPPMCLPYNPEYRPRDAATGRALLQSLARATGGIERTDWAGTWNTLRTPRAPRDLAPLLAWIAALLFLVDILERRTAFISAWLGRTRQADVGPDHLNDRQTGDPEPRRTGRRRVPVESGARAAGGTADDAVPAPPPKRDPLREARRRANRRINRG